VGRQEVAPAQLGLTAVPLPTPVGLLSEPSRDVVLPEGQTPHELRVHDLLQVHEDRRLGTQPTGRCPPRNPQRDACAAWSHERPNALRQRDFFGYHTRHFGPAPHKRTRRAHQLMDAW
jgi:hypothetical protein